MSNDTIRIESQTGKKNAVIVRLPVKRDRRIR
jgi:hypothetical protein